MSEFDIPVDPEAFGFANDLAPIEKKVAGGRTNLKCPLRLPREWKYSIDTNELIPQHNGYRELTPHEIRPVHAADYTLIAPNGEHLDKYAAVERKSASDIIGCVVQGRDRFERALERLRCCQRPVIVLECQLKDFTRKGHYSHTKLKPTAVVGSILAWSARYRIPVIPCSSRLEAIEVTKWWLIKAAQDWRAEHHSE